MNPLSIESSVSLDTVKVKPHTQYMMLADRITATRLILSPFFFIFYLFPRFFPASAGGSGAVWIVVILWIIFIISEISDFLDGMVARKRGETSDFGKIFDPFADTLTQITYFFCFVIDGILPAFLFLAVLYREFSILFIRNRMLQKGVSMGARIGGKVKTVTYVLAGALSLLASSVKRLDIGRGLYNGLTMAAVIVFVISVIIAIISFFDYLSVYNKTINIENSNKKS